MVAPLTWTGAQARVVARLGTHTLGNVAGAYPTCQAGPVDKATRRVVPIQVSDDGYWPIGFDAYEFEFDHPEMHIPTVAQGEPCISGGVPALYDGKHCSELMFHYYPFHSPASLDEEAGGSLTAGGSYQWVAVYEWRDARGVRHQSVPSPIVKIDALGEGNKTVSLVIANLTLTEHCDPDLPLHEVEIVVYRTIDGGSIFHRCTGAATGPGGAGPVPIWNDPSTPWVQFVDSYSDASIQENEILYTDGGVYPNFQPPAAKHIAHHDHRLWIVSRDDPRRIHVSKILQPGREMPGFPLSLILQSDSRHVALASLGTQLLALCEDSIQVYAGSPQDDTGSGGNLSGPHMVAPHVGCASPKSVVGCPGGVAFLSKDSFWLVSTGLQATRIGGPVEEALETYDYCLGAVLDQRRELVLWNMADLYSGVPRYGVTLVWHYLLDEWTIWRYPDSTAPSSTSPTTNYYEPGRSAAMLWRGNLGRYEYHQAQDDGTVIYHDDGWHDHNGSDPVLTVSTPPIQFAGLAGFQRVQRIVLRGTYLDPHSLTVRLYYDFSSVAGDTITFSAAEVAALVALSPGTEEHIKIHVPNQKCKAIRVEVESVSTSTGDQVRWESFAMKVAGKQGLFKLPAAASK